MAMLTVENNMPYTAADLIARLQDMTPPLDEEEEAEFTRQLEHKSRQTLAEEGCPACYPPGLPQVPEECKAIVEYWESFPGTNGAIITAQLSEWKRFRAEQRYRRMPETGTWTYTWEQFEAYEKARFRKMQHDLSQEEQELAEEKQKMEQGIPQTRGPIWNFEQSVKNQQYVVDQHAVLLRWIEEQRLKYASTEFDALQYIEPAPSSNRQESLASGPARSHRTRGSTAKPKPDVKRKRASSGQKSAAAPSRKQPEKKIPKGQKAHKAPSTLTSNAGVRKKGAPASTTRKSRQRATMAPRDRTPSEGVKLRSGRVSKPPERWVPV